MSRKPMSQSQKLYFVLGLNAIMVTGLVIAGLVSHSLGLLAAGGDYIADSMSVVLGLIAIYVRDKKHGKSKATTYVAGINGLLLLAVTLVVMYEAVHRLQGQNPEVNGLPVLIVSGIAALVMFVSAVILKGDGDDKDIHMRSVLLDTVADAVSAVAVAIAGGIILVTHGWYWLDSAIALVIGAFIAVQAVKLLLEVIKDLRTRTTAR
ncbi:cation transporter [Polaromonas sp.]|nr:cation transporter [Candidatus Saccharibacteria bacterium]